MGGCVISLGKFMWQMAPGRADHPPHFRHHSNAFPPKSVLNRLFMRAWVVFWIIGAFVLFSAGSSAAQNQPNHPAGDFWAATALRGFSFDGMNSGVVRSAARQGFELSGGQAVELADWYSPDFPNLAASFETNLGRGASVIWGGSWGEAGPKYRLGPSGLIGVVLRRPVGRLGMLSLEITGQYGGALREQLCTGDYGLLGGVQPVNCRLAASTLPPKQTLEYRWDQPAMALATIHLSYQINF